MNHPTSEAPSPLLVKSFPVGPLQCNCTVIGDPATKQAMVIDPGGDADKILALVHDWDMTVTHILHTHAHFDHFLASGDMKQATGASLALHKDDKPLWDSLEMQCGMFGMPFEPAPPPDHWLEHEEDLHTGACQCQALHTPGHTPGSMSFYFKDLNLLLAGDTLFRGSIGRTDLWGGDYPTIERSIRERLYTLDEATHVVTGHGPATTIGDELRNNAFVRG